MHYLFLKPYNFFLQYSHFCKKLLRLQKPKETPNSNTTMAIEFDNEEHKADGDFCYWQKEEDKAVDEAELPEAYWKLSPELCEHSLRV